MRLNYSCIRDVLLKLEELLTIKYDEEFDSFELCIVDIDQLYDSLQDKKYTIEDVLYVVKNLKEADYISAELKYGDGIITSCTITDITYEGNEFLNKIRPKEIWDKIKAGLSKTGAVSLPIISNVATSLITTLTKSFLGLL